MSIQPSQVASIDLSTKPEGATHYGRPGAYGTRWYKSEGSKWFWWDYGDKAWSRVVRTGGQPACIPVPIPTQPDWSKGPSNATHFGPAGETFHEAFFQLIDGSWLIAKWENDWFWREYSSMRNDRLAMLIERPKGIDWSAAPDWAHGHGLLSDDQTPAWIGKAQYLYVGSRATPYQFSSDHDHPLSFHRDDVEGYVARPAQDFASQVREGIEDAEAGNLVPLDDVKARWESRSLRRADEQSAGVERPFVPFDFSGPVIAHGLPLIVKPWEGELPPAGHPVDYLGHDGEWADGTYVGAYLGQAVVACRRSGVVGFLDYGKDSMKWEVSPWNGEGLPPAKVVCEFSLNKGSVAWATGTVIGSNGPSQVVIKCQRGDYHARNIHGVRPIRTPEQIAADERLHKIRNAATDIASTLEACSKTVAYKDIAATVLEALIDAGYARPVKA